MKNHLALWAFVSIVLLSYKGYAQNPMKEYNFKNTNNSIDLASGIPAGNGYFMAGTITPASVGPYSNPGGVVGPLSRIKLHVIDQNLNPQLLRTYVDPAELTGCGKLTMRFKVNDGKQLQNKDFVMCGKVSRNDDISPCPGLTVMDDPFILRTNVTGAVSFYKRYNKDAFFHSIVEDPTTKNLIVCGYYVINYVPYAFVAGFNQVGSPLWSYRVFDTPSYNNEVTPIDLGGKRYYAVTGLTFEKTGSAYDANNMLLLLIDANGVVSQKAMLSTGGTFSNLFTGWGINSAYDNKHVIVTGQLGDPNVSGDSASMHILKIDPLTLSVNFLKYYNNSRYTWGHSITTDPTNSKIFATGTIGASNQGTYLETNGSGVLTRLTHYTSAMAIVGYGIVYNNILNYPAFNGNSTPGSFVCINSFNYDCIDNVGPQTVAITPTIYQLGPLRPVQLIQTNATLQVYATSMQEFMSCQPPTMQALTQHHDQFNVNTEAEEPVFTIGNNTIRLARFSGVSEGYQSAVPASVNDLENNGQTLSVYPNPSGGMIHAVYSLSKSHQLSYMEVTDMYGRSIMKKQVEGNNGQVNISLPDNIASQNLILSLWCDGQILDKRTVTLIR